MELSGPSFWSTTFDVQLLYQALVFCVVVAEQLQKLLDGASYRLLRLLKEAFADRRIGECLVDLGIEAGGDGWRRPRRHKHTDPLVKHESADARFLISRHFGQRGRPRGGRLRQESECA